MNNSFSKVQPWFFFAAAFQSLFAAAALFLVPSESGVSLARLALLGALVFFFILGIYLGFLSRRASIQFLSSPAAIWFSALLFLLSGLTLFLLRYLNPERLLPYYERLSPLLWYLLALGIQSLIFCLLIQRGFTTKEWSQRKPVYISALFPFLVLFLIFLFSAITKIGITPDASYWGEPGVAILGWQFVFSILVGFGFLLFQLSSLTLQLSRLDLRPVFIYLFAVVLWLSVPVDVLQSSFYAPITPPLNTPLPYSDAGFYDYLSQSLLIGTGYLNSIPPRPLYVTFLAVLHFLFGQDYSAIIAAQTIVLALFPIALYFLGKKLHSPAAGVTAALFAIFRELMGLWISSNARVANSKIFTTDFPTALSLAFLCLVFIWWLERRDLKSNLIAGGFFGLTLLFRTQSLFVLPVVFVLAWFVFQRKTKDWLFAGILFAIPMILAVIPWLTHNYTLIGKFAFDDPNQMAILYSQYSFNETFDLTEFDIQSESLGSRMLTFTLQNPAYVATFITAHFLNTEIGGLLSLPLIKSFDGIFSPVNMYWIAWDGSIEWYNLALLIIYLAVIALGLGGAWNRMGWLGLIPLAVNIGYALSNAVSRFSSWRYNMPVDWVIYFYFAIGIMEILGGMVLLFNIQAQKIFPAAKQLKAKPLSLQDFRPHYLAFILAFTFIGAAPWIAKSLASPRYTSTQEQMVTKLVSAGYHENEINQFLSQQGSLMLEGRVMYPRMYRRDEGISSANPWPAYKVKEYPRMAFILLNDRRYDAIFPTKDIFTLPQGADAVLLACQNNDHIEIRAMVFAQFSNQSAPLTDPCPSTGN